MKFEIDTDNKLVSIKNLRQATTDSSDGKDTCGLLDAKNAMDSIFGILKPFVDPKERLKVRVQLARENYEKLQDELWRMDPDKYWNDAEPEGYDH